MKTMTKKGKSPPPPPTSLLLERNLTNHLLLMSWQ